MTGNAIHKVRGSLAPFPYLLSFVASFLNFKYRPGSQTTQKLLSNRSSRRAYTTSQSTRAATSHKILITALKSRAVCAKLVVIYMVSSTIRQSLEDVTHFFIDRTIMLAYGKDGIIFLVPLLRNLNPVFALSLFSPTSTILSDGIT
jgi:hypothetical protein